MERLIGLLFVVVLHSAALYSLWSYRIIPAPDKAVTLFVNLINPPPPPAPQPRPHQPEPPKPVKSPPPPEPPQLAAEAPVLSPAEPVAPPPPPAPVIEAPAIETPLPPQPVALSTELSVSCPKRSPPAYPFQSKRLNEQGKVVLRVELDEEGRVVSAYVQTGSGYPRLDDASLNAVKTWRCKPAMRNGAPVHAVALQPFNFILKGR